MTIEELKRVLVEVKEICLGSERCCDCPFRYDTDDGRVMCRLSDDENVMFTPLCWDIDDWKEETHSDVDPT